MSWGPLLRHLHQHRQGRLQENSPSPIPTGDPPPTVHAYSLWHTLSGQLNTGSTSVACSAKHLLLLSLEELVAGLCSSQTSSCSCLGFCWLLANLDWPGQCSPVAWACSRLVRLIWSWWLGRVQESRSYRSSFWSPWKRHRAVSTTFYRLTQVTDSPHLEPRFG